MGAVSLGTVMVPCQINQLATNLQRGETEKSFDIGGRNRLQCPVESYRRRVQNIVGFVPAANVTSRPTDTCAVKDTC